MNGFASQLQLLEERLVLTPTSDEQLFIYLVNKIRHDPRAYDDEASLGGILDRVEARQPLAVNGDLMDSGRFHATEMAEHDYFAHKSAVTGDWPNQMAVDQGYELPSYFPLNQNWIESIAAGFATLQSAIRELIVDSGVPSLGHRKHLLGMEGYADNREVGVGFAFDANSHFQRYWAFHSTFSDPDDVFLTGVVFQDTDGDQQFGLNEGLGGVTVSIEGTSLQVQTNAAGGWSIQVPDPGSYTVKVNGGGFAGTALTTLTVQSLNREIDCISGAVTGVVDFSSNDINQLPTIPAGQAFSIVESSPLNTVVGTVSASDPDTTAPNKTLTYSIVGGNTSTAFSINASTGQISVKNPAALNLASPQFTLQVKVADGGSPSLSATQTVTIDVTPANHAPTVVNSIPDQTAIEDTVFTLTFAANTFVDGDAGDTLTYSATSSSGAALPAWMTFTAATRTFSGTPLNANVGTISIKVTATDHTGASVSDAFDLVVANSNDAPTVAKSIADRNATEDIAFTFTFEALVFADEDFGDTLTYSAAKSDGMALPSWLTFNGSTRTFSGTPLNADFGVLTINVTATDRAGATANDSFDVVVANTNDAPTVANPIPDLNAMEDVAFTLTFPATTFADVDVGDTLIYTATKSGGSTLPAWLTFDSSTRTFSGTPRKSDVGTVSVDVVATDGHGPSARDTFNIIVIKANGIPTLANPVPDQNAVEDSAFTLTVAANTFIDPDVGDTLTYSATGANGTALPSWLTFNSSTRTFSGTPLNADVGVLSIVVTATDGAGATANDSFDVVVANTNDAPTVANPIPDRNAIEDIAFTFTFPVNTFADVDVNDAFTYSATEVDGSALPNWLTFNSSTRTFSGTPRNSDVGTVSVDVVAIDGHGTSAKDTFDIVVGNANGRPVLVNPIPDQNATEDSAFRFTIAANTFSDSDAGDTLDYSATRSNGTPLPSWLTFNSSTRTFSGTPLNADVGILSVKVTATDGAGAAESDTFDLVVANTNDAPMVVNPIPDRNVTEDFAFTLPLPADTFVDIDFGDTLTYSATKSGGSTLPAWLTFNSSTRTFSGTPHHSDIGTMSVEIVAMDGHGTSARDTFNIVVVKADGNPVLTNPIPDRNAVEDSAFTFTMAANTFIDSDVGDTLTYSAARLNGMPLPSWLTFNSSTRTFSGTPLNADVGILSIRVTATDGTGSADNDTFNVVVANTNDAPTVANPIVSRSTSEDLDFTMTFPANTFADVDLGDTLTYSATRSDGSALPAWLTFNGFTRTFSGTPRNSDVGTESIDIVAKDGHGTSARATFSIVVVNANDAPALLNLIPDQNATEDSAFKFTIAADTFIDTDLGDTLKYTVTQVNGLAVPSWLTFVAATRSFSGVPLNSDVGVISIKVTAKDLSGAATSDNFDIVITNSNDPPVVVNPIPDQGVTINSAFSFVLPALTFRDIDFGDVLSFSVRTATGAALPSWLTYIPGTQTFSGTPLESDLGPLSLTVTALDSHGASTSDTFVILVNDVNHSPNISDGQIFSIPENLAVDSVIGKIIATDPDLIPLFSTLAFSLSGNPGNAFSIDGVTGEIRVHDASLLDYESTPRFTASVTATDGGGLSATQSITIQLTDQNEAPVAIELTRETIAENEQAAALVGKFTTSDPDSADTFTYELASGPGGEDNGSFAIAHDQLRVASSFDFEGKKNYGVRVRTTDQNGLSYETLFIIEVTNVNEAPIDVELSKTTIAENQPDATVIGTLSGIDPDAGDTLNYSLVSGAGSADNNRFVVSGNQLLAVSGFDFEGINEYTIRVQTVDQGGLTFEKQITITVTDVNEPPSSIDLSELSVAENQSAGTVVGIFHSSDPDTGNSMSYTFESGLGDSDNALFSIFNDQLVTATKFDFETTNRYTIRVRTADQAGLTFARSFEIAVTDANDAPTDLALSGTSLPENQGDRAMVGTFSSTDPDSGNRFTYSLVEGVGSANNGSFSIVNSQLRATSTFDFETKNQYFIRVRTTDQGNLTFEKQFTISVTDAKEAPTNLSLSASTIAENQPAGTVIGTFKTTDPDDVNIFTYALVTGPDSADNDSFEIDNGQFRAASSFDYENQSSYRIRVRTTDQNELSFEREFTIAVSDVNEAPTLVPGQSFTIFENSSQNMAVGSVASTDPDTSASFSSRHFAIASGNIGNAFEIDPISGLLNVNSTAALDFETTPTFSLQILLMDGAGAMAVPTVVTIHLTDVNEGPTISRFGNQTIPEDGTTGVLTFNIGDVESAAQSLTVQAKSSNQSLIPDANLIRFGEGRVQSLVVTPLADQFGQATITLSVSDGTNVSTTSFVVTVNSVADAPTLTGFQSQTILEDTSTGSLAFKIGDVDGVIGNIVVTTTSSNHALVSNVSIVVTGVGADRSLIVTPIANQSGTTVIAVTVSDGLLAASQQFTLTVSPVEDPTVISLNSQPLVFVGSAKKATAFDSTAAIIDADTPNPQFDGAILKISGQFPGDQFSILKQGGALRKGKNVWFNGQIIGTVEGGKKGSPLTIHLTVASRSAVESLLRNVGYKPAKNSTGVRSIQVQITDDGSSVSAIRQIEFRI